MKLCACKHLDFNEATYGEAAELRTLTDFEGVVVKYWKRRPHMLHNDAVSSVQFCGQGRGRINGIFQCYDESEMSCYQASEEGKST